MVELPKYYGKKLIQILPKYVKRTCHGRHYYATDCEEVWDRLEEIKKDEMTKRKKNYSNVLGGDIY